MLQSYARYMTHLLLVRESFSLILPSSLQDQSPLMLITDVLVKFPTSVEELTYKILKFFDFLMTVQNVSTLTISLIREPTRVQTFNHNTHPSAQRLSWWPGSNKVRTWVTLTITYRILFASFSHTTPNFTNTTQLTSSLSVIRIVKSF
jgi:hypothetical protein